MSNRLKKIIENNKKEILERGIVIDESDGLELDFVEQAEQIDLFSEKSFTRITLFEAGRLYIQILDIETEETLFFFDDILEGGVDLENFIIHAIRIM